MTGSQDPTPYRFPAEPGPGEPLPPELDTVDGFRKRARLVRPGAEPAGRVALAGERVPVYRVADTVPIETDADLDATSAAPASSRAHGVYDYVPARDGPDEEA